MFEVFNIANAQNYFPFPDSNTVWSVSQMKYGIKGDTIINSLNYKKYYRQIYDSFYDFRNTTYFAAIREDSKKIYGIKSTDSVEKLLYDFTMVTGDTVYTYPFEPEYNNQERKLKISKTDSIIINGNYRKMYVIKTVEGYRGVMDEYWIQGIGSTSGIFNQGNSFNCVADCQVSILLCFHQNDTLKYISEDYHSCYQKSTGGAIEETSQNRIKSIIYPNPVTGKSVLNTNLRLSNSNNIRFYNSLGKLVSVKCSKDTDIEINKSDFSNGIFFYQLFDKNKMIDTGSFIVE